MNINNNDTLVVIIDPQNDALAATGVSWDLVSDGIHENWTIENIEYIFKAVKQNEFKVFAELYERSHFTD